VSLPDKSKQKTAGNLGRSLAAYRQLSWKDRVISTAAELYAAVANEYKEKKTVPRTANKTAKIVIILPVGT